MDKHILGDASGQDGQWMTLAVSNTEVIFNYPKFLVLFDFDFSQFVVTYTIEHW